MSLTRTQSEHCNFIVCSVSDFISTFALVSRDVYLNRIYLVNNINKYIYIYIYLVLSAQRTEFDKEKTRKNKRIFQLHDRGCFQEIYILFL